MLIFVDLDSLKCVITSMKLFDLEICGQVSSPLKWIDYGKMFCCVGLVSFHLCTELKLSICLSLKCVNFEFEIACSSGSTGMVSPIMTCFDPAS